jgi:hypothetical protein
MVLLGQSILLRSQSAASCKLFAIFWCPVILSACWSIASATFLIVPFHFPRGSLSGLFVSFPRCSIPVSSFVKALSISSFVLENTCGANTATVAPTVAPTTAPTTFPAPGSTVPAAAPSSPPIVRPAPALASTGRAASPADTAGAWLCCLAAYDMPSETVVTAHSCYYPVYRPHHEGDERSHTVAFGSEWPLVCAHSKDASPR